MSRQAPRPTEAPRRRRSGMFGLGPLGLVPLVAAALVVAVGIGWLRGRETPAVGGSPAPSPSAVASDVAVASSSPSVAPATASPEPATPAATIGPCDPNSLAARILMWEGAAGSRIATVELQTTSAAPCEIATVWRPELVDGSGRIRIEGQPPTNAGVMNLEPGQVVKTLVEAANDCGPTPVPPVTMAFVTDDGSRVVAEPETPDDTTTPPCNGQTLPGTIEMHPWGSAR